VTFWNYYQTTLILSTEYMREHGLKITTPCEKVVHSQCEGTGQKIRPGKTVKTPPPQV
jgi:hypothetical protein